MFQVGHTPAHKGQHTTTDPIKDLEVVHKIKEFLSVRDRALFSVAINSALRAADLCRLQWDDAEDDGSTITLRLYEGKTKKFRQIPLNPSASADLRAWRGICDHTNIYSGQRGGMTIHTWGRLVKSWCQQAGLKGKFCSHTTRKTFVRIQHDEFGTSMAVLMDVLNHSSERMTLRYMGKLGDDVVKAYSHSI